MIWTSLAKSSPIKFESTARISGDIPLHKSAAAEKKSRRQLDGYEISIRQPNLETIMKGMSWLWHQVKNFKNPGSRHTSGHKILSTTTGSFTITTNKPRRSISLHSSNVCPLSAMLANIFLNPSLQMMERASAQHASVAAKARKKLPEIPQSSEDIEIPLSSFLLSEAQIIGHICDYAHRSYGTHIWFLQSLESKVVIVPSLYPI